MRKYQEPVLNKVSFVTEDVITKSTLQEYLGRTEMTEEPENIRSFSFDDLDDPTQTP